MAETCLFTARPSAFSINNQRRQYDHCFQLTCTKSTQVWYLAGLLVVQYISSVCTRPREAVSLQKSWKAYYCVAQVLFALNNVIALNCSLVFQIVVFDLEAGFIQL